MSDEIKFDYVTPEEVLAWKEKEKHFFLIHTLTNNHFRKVHLPGAQNACVFEVTFLDQIKSITADKNAQIVLYGSSERSMDAVTAAEKLKLDGYQRIMILKGGIESWRALGYPLQGESAEMAGDPETRLLLPEGEYKIDTDQSTIEWFGRNPAPTAPPTSSKTRSGCGLPQRCFGRIGARMPRRSPGRDSTLPAGTSVVLRSPNRSFPSQGVGTAATSRSAGGLGRLGTWKRASVPLRSHRCRRWDARKDPDSTPR